MARIPEEEVNIVRKKADIVDVIGKYLQVQKKGKDYKTLCPFHNDHDPSMSINTERQIYKCFVCGAGGNVFSFVMNYEHLSFPEAVEKVADLVGVTLSVKADVIEKPVDPHIQKIHQILDETIRFTTYQLNTAEATSVRSYLDQRGLTQEVREKFDIGYNPSNHALSKFLLAKGFLEADLNEANVIRVTENGIHDIFESRIMFPIHDPYGKPIGFSARTMDPNNTSKYINTNDTPVFHKSELVYNAHRAKNIARKEGKVFVCEGVTDVIAFSRAGIDNVVCTLGTSCTKQQIQILKSLASLVVFCYDGDNAGQAATWRACKMAQEAGLEVRVIRNLTGKDPDEIIKEQGSEALIQLSKSEITWMEFVFQFLEKKTNFDNYIEKKEFVEKVKQEIDLLNDDVDRQYFTEQLSNISGFHLEYQPKQNRVNQFVPQQVNVSLPNGLQEAEEQVLAMMMRHQAATRRFEETLGFLSDPNRNTLAMMIVDEWRSYGALDIAQLIDHVDGKILQDLITKLCESWAYNSEYDVDILDGAIRKINISLIEEKAESYKQQLLLPMNSETQKLVLQEYQECLLQLRRYYSEEERQKQ